MSCMDCLSNNDILTPDEISVLCTTPYFHKCILTPRAGRTLSVYADTSTINIQNSLKFHVVCAASKVLQNYNDLGLKKLFKF